MLELIITVILCIFAAVGMAHTYNKYIAGIFKPGESDLSSPTVLFTVKNREEDAELMLRSFIWKYAAASGECEIPCITVVDLNSEDETMSILRKLEEEYSFLNVYDKQSYINKIQREL